MEDKSNSFVFADLFYERKSRSEFFPRFEGEFSEYTRFGVTEARASWTSSKKNIELTLNESCKCCYEEKYLHPVGLHFG